SIRRGALLKQPGVQHAGETTPAKVQGYEATAEELALAEKALALVPQTSAPLLYARIDLAPGPTGEPLILEVEVTEPSLFLEYARDGVERLADGIVAALARDR